MIRVPCLELCPADERFIISFIIYYHCYIYFRLILQGRVRPEKCPIAKECSALARDLGSVVSG